jgi:LEA14-like dessication related protein
MAKKYLFPTLLVVLIVSGCTQIKEPEFRRLDNFKLKSIGLSEAKIGLTVTYYNPNNFTMTVKETSAQVSLEGVDLGRFVQDTLVTVGANAEFSIPISGAVSVNKLMQMNLPDLANREVLIRATGTTKVGKAGIFITKPFTYEGRHRLDQIRL